MSRPSVFDLELADLVQDRILRKRRSRGESASFSEDEYDLLVQQEMQKTKAAFKEVREMPTNI